MERIQLQLEHIFESFPNSVRVRRFKQKMLRELEQHYFEVLQETDDIRVAQDKVIEDMDDRATLEARMAFRVLSKGRLFFIIQTSIFALSAMYIIYISINEYQLAHKNILLPMVICSLIVYPLAIFTGLQLLFKGVEYVDPKRRIRVRHLGLRYALLVFLIVLSVAYIYFSASVFIPGLPFFSALEPLALRSPLLVGATCGVLFHLAKNPPAEKMETTT